MDNMLYIIAGLIIILLIGVWILRKNKAQRPLNQSIRQDSSAPSLAPIHHIAAANATTSTATMFDDITVAQRFIDQQRYDKAIETLERGLSQKPNDSALSLKLLNVYALSNNNEAFYNTYAAITAHGDMATIEQASQLKELLDEDQGTQASTAFTQNHKADIDLDSVSKAADSSIATLVPAHPNRTPDANNISLDFDFPTSTANKESAATPVVDNNIKHQDNTLNNTFDLTLDDLESTDETTVFEQDSLLDTENLDIENNAVTLDFSAIQSPDAVANTENNAIDNLILDFDTIKNGNQIQPVIDSSFNSHSDTHSESDFALDFESLLNDVVDTKSITEQVDTFIDDFILNSDESLAPDIGNKTSIDASVPSIENTQVKSVDNDFSLFFDEVADEETGFDAMGNDATSTDSVTSTDINQHGVQNTTPPNINIAHENTLTFGDDSDIEALDFNIDSNEQAPILSLETVSTDSISSPVPLSEDKDVDLSTNFDAQFAADFAFVDTLDSHQITLDLADQYLQLGEYDSAKRLLNEVVAQGNSEQQQQAQLLLARTA
ncbi:FimV/HubP family polar landmark protein [Psychrobacter sp. GP33]|uniref:FimV/HubP family polar landmark protein n=1 Tax=Psychrobacter sp. GP33 TaxID=2758709 RepID=UPI0015FCFEC2|nr:FimV/HubP family polar landmark protein [Psychrobacter sp. GP33]